MPNTPVAVLALWLLGYLLVGLILEAFYRWLGHPTPAHHLPYALAVGTFRALAMLAYISAVYVAIVVARPAWERSIRFAAFLSTEERKRGLG